MIFTIGIGLGFAVRIEAEFLTLESTEISCGHGTLKLWWIRHKWTREQVLLRELVVDLDGGKLLVCNIQLDACSTKYRFILDKS